MLADSQLQAFSVARRLVMFSDVVRTCREKERVQNMGTTQAQVSSVFFSSLLKIGVKLVRSALRTYSRGGLIREQNSYGLRTLLTTKSVKPQ